jgi:hypothetical protein
VVVITSATVLLGMGWSVDVVTCVVKIDRINMMS